MPDVDTSKFRWSAEVKTGADDKPPWAILFSDSVEYLYENMKEVYRNGGDFIFHIHDQKEDSYWWICNLKQAKNWYKETEV